MESRSRSVLNGQKKYFRQTRYTSPDELRTKRTRNKQIGICRCRTERSTLRACKFHCANYALARHPRYLRSPTHGLGSSFGFLANRQPDPTAIMQIKCKLLHRLAKRRPGNWVEHLSIGKSFLWEFLPFLSPFFGTKRVSSKETVN